MSLLTKFHDRLYIIHFSFIEIAEKKYLKIITSTCILKFGMVHHDLGFRISVKYRISAVIKYRISVGRGGTNISDIS